ncbi:TonB-dependent receptor [Sphingobium jiangsuense]|uniref:Iron complex outermembrane receptor protein n=1 Tax=Sphingobium jiangsuense TaxID=870476 RepID=A0A7W6BQZ4_9SPHN|nr:TonB-dependent receptor [Sphingobium jiangsuense]MBB3927173.1 iron complex outermembrane receptor protein [Sphingobium jiangsuense]GLS99547.1 TonB-dependent receptor [Sphingobium jiangsuense]
MRQNATTFMSAVSTLCGILAGAGLYALSVTSAHAGALSGADAEDGIIVTARGRAEAEIAVPDSIAVYTPADIAARKLTTIDEFIAATPGIFMIHDQDPGTNLISVRGVSTNRNQSPSIAYIVDGLALPDAELFTLRPYDIAGVEILKGPQGALFGRSASGGAINMTTGDPGPDWGGEASVGAGNGFTWTADGVVNAPVSEQVQLRLAGSYRNSEGFIRNSFLDRKVDGSISRNLRLKAKVALSETGTLRFRLGWANEEGGAAYISSGNVTGLYGGRLSGAALTDPFGDFEGRASRTWWGAQATYEQDIGESLRLIWTGGHDDYHKDFVEELDFRNDPVVTVDGFPFPGGLQPIAQPVDIRAWTSELRLVSRDPGPLRWHAGFFFQRLERDRTDDFGPLLFGAEAPRAETRSNQIGLFAQASYDLTPQIEATLALRYDSDRRKEDTVGTQSGAIFARRAHTFDKWQPKVSLAWRPTGDFTAYVTGAIGFKAGGFNPLPGPSDLWQADFAAETTRSVEAGVKARLADGRVRLSLAGFVTDYENFQNTVFLGNSVVLSVPQVDVHGVEASAQADLGAGFRVDGGLAWTRSRVGRYTTPNPTPEPGEPLILDLRGKRTPNAPDWTVNGGLGWQGEAGPVAISARASVAYVSRVDFEIDNILHSPGYASVDSRIGLTRGPWSLELWAKNLFDKRWAISAFGQQQLPLLLGLGPNGPFDSFTINTGRQFGATAGWRF